MKRFVVLFFLVFSVSAALAQQSFTRQREDTARRENSTVESQQMTLNVASLFFPMLAELESRLKSSRDLTNFLVSKIEDGSWTPPPNLSPSFMAGCKIFSNDRFVWGTPPGVVSQKTDMRLITHIGSIGWGTPQMMVTGVLNEGPYAPATTDSIRYGGVETYGPTGGSAVLGVPLRPEEHLRCLTFYSRLIDSAIARLIKTGAFKNGVIHQRDLRNSASRAILTAIAMGDFKMPDPISPPLQCLVPSFTSFSNSNTTYKCGAWVVSQQPLKAEFGGMTVLSQDAVNGVRYAFQDTLSGTVAKSQARSDRRTAKISR